MNRICAFAGYRPKKITLDYDSDSNAYSSLINEAAKIIADLAACREIEIFYTDMSMGMGMWCAEIVLSLQKQFSDLKLIADIPFHGQCNNWPESYQKQYRHILSYCHKVVYLNKKYNDMCYHDSAFDMVTKSDILLAVCNQETLRGVAGRTARLAQEFNKEVLYINPLLFPPVYKRDKYSNDRNWNYEYLL